MAGSWMKEKDFQKQVLQYAALRGWRTAHFGNTVKIVRRGDSYTTIADPGAAGFPDVVFIRPPRVVFAELKAGRNKLTPDQAAWLAALAACEMDVHCWRPDDWSTITECLH